MKRRMADDTHAHVARARRLRSSLVLGGLVLAAVLSTRWVRLNLSPSLPYGLYRLAALRAPLTRGTLVVLPVPRSLRPWHAAWVPLLKPVAGVAGDTVCHRHHTLYVNGIAFGPVYQAAHGQPLPQIAEGCLMVQEGDVFLASPAPNSLDGRYTGPVPLTALTAQAFPLSTWR
jgi:type IV secretory pathway protease TraF